MVVPTAASRSSMNSSSTSAPGGPATCLSCHMEDPTLTNGGVEAGADWRCGRCGQRWDAVRLRTVAAYAAWLSARAASPAH